MEEPRRPASFLASVTGESEARLCVELGADIIDAKNPVQGALGALPGERVRAIRAALPAAVPVSATIGDPADDPDSVAHAARFMAAAGADIVKVGFWPKQRQEGVVRRLGALSLARVRFVAVLLVDHGLDLELVAPIRDAGFAGIMLDTADKRAGALPERLAESALAEFVNAVQSQGLFAGLAGSLRAGHVPQLLALGPDVLGFRGGLCRDGARTGSIDAAAVRAVRDAIPSLETCRAPSPGAMAPWQPERAV
ncbi:MAG TPA: (5-formylfuran-3-yl)methyl phosphate synthase [Hyphomicrobium sp.]